MSRMDKTLGNAAAPEEPTEQELEDGVSAPPARFSNTVDVDTGSMPIPWLMLAQGMSKAVNRENNPVKVGTWFIEGYEPVSEVVLIPMNHAHSRRYSMQKPEGGFETICYAPPDRPTELHGIGNPGIECAECPLSEWTPVEGGKNKPPVCKLQIEFRAWSVTHGIPVRVGFRSGSEAAGRFIEMMGKARGLGNFGIRLTSERKQMGAFSVPVAKATLITVDDEMLITAKDFLALPA